MAIVVYPLNNIDFSAEDVAIYNSTRTSGIYAGDDFAISLTGSDNTISIDVGLAWMHLSRFNGVAVALKSKTYVDMGLPNATYPRIDALVLQFDANKNGAELVSKQGTASSNPIPPAVTRTESLYELHLLHVRREPGAASITAVKVTDLRLNEQYCGIMADSVTRVDTEAINAQVTALIQKLRDDLQKVEDQDYYASKEYVREISVLQNLIDNSDFEHFIAQAGIGGKHGNQAYAGDRWILDSGTVTGDAREDGNGYTNITLNGTIRQIVANPPEVGTAAIEMISGIAEITYADGEITITSDGGIIKNVALYCSAENMPVYHSKGYSAEYLECARYYTKVTLHRPTVSFSTVSKFLVNVTVPVVMRIRPTIKLDTYSIEYLRINGESISIDLGPSEAQIYEYRGGTTIPVTVEFEPSLGSTGKIYEPAYVRDFFTLEFSADL